MSRSQLLKDIVSGQVQIENILWRLKVILSDLGNDLIMNWVNGELQGYKKEETVPKYRILKGHPIGTYLVNGVHQYTNALVPLEYLLPEDRIDNLKRLEARESIATIQNVLNGENRENYAKTVDTSFCHFISNDELQIVGMRVAFASNQLDEIVSNVKSKLVDIVMELEKQFDDLDNLDIKSQLEENYSNKEKAVYNIVNIIDDSINIGDKNRFSKSTLGNFLGLKDKT